MVLQSGQVRELYVWVHPQFQPAERHSANAEMEIYKDFLMRVRESPNTAVLQVKSSCIDKDPYSLEVERRINAQTDYMIPLLDGRYAVWTGGFFDARVPRNVEKLRRRLSLKDQLDTIKVFGKIVNLCPKQQAYNFGLRSLTFSLTYHPVETPEIFLQKS